MLELDIQPHPELFEVALQCLEVDREFSRDGDCLFARERFLDSHLAGSSPVSPTHSSRLHVCHESFDIESGPEATSVTRMRTLLVAQSRANTLTLCYTIRDSGRHKSA